MKSILKYLFINNWLRKVISLVLALIIWYVLDQSLTTTKTISNVGVRVINLPQGKTVTGLQPHGRLSKKIDLTLTGKKTLLEDLTSNDFEVVIDAYSQQGENITTISKKHLMPTNTPLKLASNISKIGSKNLMIELVPMAKEKIPVYVTKPIGEAPRGYQFLDVWPYHLSLSVSGPEETIKRLKSRGIKLTFNLNEIATSSLDNLQGSHSHKDIVSFAIPNEWKNIYLPEISDQPIAIDDAEAKYLRIDFIRSQMVPLKFAVPVALYIPPEHAQNVKPQSISLANSDIIKTKHGVKVIGEPLYAKGVSEAFLNVIKDMLEIVIIFSSAENQDGIQWSNHVMNPRLLEDRYVSAMVTDIFDEEIRDMHPRFREEYLRNRFRNYMNRLQLFTKDEQPLNLCFELRGKELVIKNSVQMPTVPS